MKPDRHHWEFDEVLARTDLRFLLDEVTQSNGKHGSLAKWHCPDPHHDDNRPSVTVSADHRGKERWRCWSNSDHRGDAIDLVRTVRGVGAVEAVDWLAGRAGMTPNKPLPPPLPRKPRGGDGPVLLDPRVERYVAKAEAVLRGRQGDPMREWLHARGLTNDTIIRNRIGADVGRSRMRRPRGLPYGAGPGVVFPAFDHSAQVSYVQTRYLDPETTGRKYDNPSSQMGTNPRISFTQSAPSTNPTGLLLVTEGIPDGLIAAQAGIDSVSIMGSQTPDAVSATRIANHAVARQLGIVLAVDSDPAGTQAVVALERHLIDAGAAPVVVHLPEGLDLNDWALQASDWFTQVIDAAAALGIGIDDKSLEPVGVGTDRSMSGPDTAALETAEALRSHEVVGREL